jgi:hypothetical protein
MTKERIFIVGDETRILQEEVSLRPYNLTDADIIHAATVMSIARFIWDYEARLQDPSFYADIPTFEIPEYPKKEPSFFDRLKRKLTWLRKLIHI